MPDQIETPGDCPTSEELVLYSEDWLCTVFYPTNSPLSIRTFLTRQRTPPGRQQRIPEYILSGGGCHAF